MSGIPLRSVWLRVTSPGSLYESVFNLSVLQSSTYVLPLLTVPYLSRVLGPANWGMVAMFQSAANYLTALIEYGFPLAGPREVARSLEDAGRRSSLLSGVLGVKLALAVAVTLAVEGLAQWIPAFGENVHFRRATLIYAFGQSFSLLWYFQGIESLRLVTVWHLLGKLGGTVAIFAFVRSREDAWLALLLPGVGALVAVAVMFVQAYRHTAFSFPTRSSVAYAARVGASMFLYRVAATAYTSGNALILAMFASPATVGLYYGAEKIARSVTSLLNPVCQGLYPRVSHLVQLDSADAQILARKGLGLMTAGGVAAGLGIAMFSRQALTIALGPAFISAEPALRTLAPLPAVVALNLALGFLWLLPNQMDHDFIRITVAAAVLNLALGTLLSRAFGMTGMALAAVLVEGAVSVLMLLCLRARRRQSPVEKVTEGRA